MVEIIYDAKQHKFIAAEGSERFSPNFVFADKWNCRVYEDGSVKCSSADIVDGKYFETNLKINKSGLVTVCQMKNRIRSGIKCYKIRNWPVVGIITLTGGNIENRTASFVDIKLYRINREEI